MKITRRQLRKLIEQQKVVAITVSDKEREEIKSKEGDAKDAKKKLADELAAKQSGPDKASAEDIEKAIDKITENKNKFYKNNKILINNSIEKEKKMSNNLDRSKIRKMILKEFKMMGVADMGAAGMEPMGMSHSHDMEPAMPSGQMGGVSKEDCCAAVMCLIECCSCPVTKQALMQCCQDILAGRM